MYMWTSLVIQWIRIGLPMQRTRVVWSVLQKDSTCHGATKSPPQPLGLHTRACVPQRLSRHSTIAKDCVPTACALQQEKPPQWEARALQWRGTPAHCIERKPLHTVNDQAKMEPGLSECTVNALETLRHTFFSLWLYLNQIPLMWYKTNFNGILLSVVNIWSWSP